MSTGELWFRTTDCMWDIVCRRPDHEQLMEAAYFRREDAQKEADRLRKQYPRATICVRVSDWRTYTIINLFGRCTAMASA